MVNVVCYDANGNKLEKLTQWDFNQTLVVKGADVSSVPVFHFCNKNSKAALVVTSTVNGDEITAKIPNTLLQYGFPIIAYMYYESADGSAKTCHTIIIPVLPRLKPADYEYVENIDYVSLAIIDARLSTLLNAISNNSEAAATAELTDIRVGYDGTLYATAGDAVRTLGEQLDDLSGKLDDVSNSGLSAADASENQVPTADGKGGWRWNDQQSGSATGEDGVYYVPSVDSDGNLTWTASKAGMPQVSGANIKGSKGDAGVGIASIARTSGTGAAGTTDTYTITMTDGSTSTFTVYNGKDGASGSGSSAVTSVNGKTGDVKLPVSGFGSCATAASTAIKVVDGLPEDFLVEDGVQLCVKFSNANTAAAPQLSVAGASAPIFDARTSNNVEASAIGARTHHFVYFSGIWVLLDALQIPVPTSDDHGKFLRVSGHAYVLDDLTLDIPSGGGGEWETVIDTTFTESASLNTGDMPGKTEMLCVFAVPKSDSNVNLTATSKAFGKSLNGFAMVSASYGKIGVIYAKKICGHAIAYAGSGDTASTDPGLDTTTRVGINLQYYRITTNVTDIPLKLTSALPAGTIIKVFVR